MEAPDIAELQKVRALRWSIILVGLVLALFISLIFSLSIGAVNIPFTEVLNVLMGGGSARDQWIITNLRLPRIFLAGLVGASLALAGAAMQGLFRNPMASPSIIGISAGAAFGASLAIVLGVSWVSGAFAIPAMAFVFSFVTLFLVYAVSRNRGGYVPVETLLLAGIAIGALFSALVSALQYFSGDKLSGVVFWLMGGLNNATWEQVLISIPPVILGSAVIMVLARELNAMMVGEEQAGNLGINCQPDPHPPAARIVPYHRDCRIGIGDHRLCRPDNPPCHPYLDRTGPPGPTARIRAGRCTVHDLDRYPGPNGDSTGRAAGGHHHLSPGRSVLHLPADVPQTVHGVVR